MAVVATRSQVATGTVYRHFPSKQDLFAEVFRRASQREVDVLRATTERGEPAAARLAAWVEAFVRRALAEPTRAYALIAEPVDPAVEAERLTFRRVYADLFARALRDGVESGELPALDADLTAAAIVGALAEALVGPLQRRGRRGRRPRRPPPGLRPQIRGSQPVLTHDVDNQSIPFEEVNLFDTDLALQEALERENGGWAIDRVRDAGAVAGSAEAQAHGRRAERNEPRLLTHDRFGHRLDEVELDPSWHWLLRGAVEREIHSLPWRDPRPGAHVARAALELLWTHANAGVMCPVSMTYSAVPAIRTDPGLAAEWEPRLTLPDYDRGALCGMAMTEKQGGSDVRANTTRAEPAGDGLFELTGHKWFCSYPPCDVFLVLAQAPAGLSCFLLERGPGMEFQRLKDKLGTRSLPSSEVEFRAAPARLLGEEGRGVATIIEMVTHTRLDCVIGSAAGMRRGVAEAVHHARHRSAFGRRLVDQPAMVNVLADLAIESEAATATALRLARAYDEGDTALRRFATAVLKYWICKRATPHAAEALECLGGNGYVEESPMPRLLRDAPLNGIWEGSGNVMALDVLRATAREAEGLPAFLAECELARGADARLDAHLDALPRARRRVERPPHRRGPRARLPGIAARPPRPARRRRRVLRRPPRRRPRARVRDPSAGSRRRRHRRARTQWSGQMRRGTSPDSPAWPACQ